MLLERTWLGENLQGGLFWIAYVILPFQNLLVAACKAVY